MREQVELLEQHPGPQPQLADPGRGVAIAVRRSGSASTTTPAMSTTPAVGSSRKFRQRRNVLLPLPDRPRIVTVSPGIHRHRAPTQDVVVVEVLLDRGRLDDRLGAGLDEVAGPLGRVDDVVDAGRAPLAASWSSTLTRSPVAMRRSRRLWNNENRIVRTQ